MSRHHMTLPPVIYMPTPKTKPAQRRSNVGRVFKRGSISAKSDADETDETEEASGVGRHVTAVAGRSDRDDSSEHDGSPKRKTYSTTGLMSESTLKLLLQVQEQSTAAGDAPAGPAVDPDVH